MRREATTAPGDLVRRDQMAVFPAQSALTVGGSYAAPLRRNLVRRALSFPHSPTGSRTSRRDGITGGCGGGNYCPAFRQHARTDGGVPVRRRFRFALMPRLQDR